MYDNGDIYKGVFQRDKRHGMGMMLYKDGRFYKGNWANDVIVGRGVYKIKGEPDSLIVEGTFDNGKLVTGQVKVQYRSGELYEGRMTHHYSREGVNCKFYFNNGDKYEGDYLKDKRHGKGKLYFDKGGMFEGVFKEDEIYDGKLVDANDNHFENNLKSGGIFLRGKLNG